MKPTEAAAAVSPSRAVASDQKQGCQQCKHPASPQKRIICTGNARLSASPEKRIPVPRNSGTAVCHRRSPLLSQCHPTNKSENRAARYGNTPTSVTVRVENPETRLRIVGNQIVKP